jgi:hypothetical protein
VHRRASWVAIAVATSLLASDKIAPLGTYTPAEKRHWSFRPRTQPAIPTFATAADKAWAKTPIDAFVLARLKKEDLRPSPKADPTTLVRRVYYDLTGLPPTPQQIQEFVADKSPDAWAKLVDRLLDTDQYAERWAQHWLDVVRFGESEGFEYDTHLKDAWRYRDYVVRAFRNDKPYNIFITEQLAGDEIAPKEEETLIASGFNRLMPVRRNAGNQDVASSRNEVLTEMTNIVGQAMLGVTLGCARCHDHKFDPIRQSDYYRMQAYFAGTFPEDSPRVKPEEVAVWKQKTEAIQAEIKTIRAEMMTMRGKPEMADQREALRKKIEELQENLPEALPSVHTVVTKPAEQSPIHLLGRGDYMAKGDKVHARPMGILIDESVPELPPTTAKPRAELAKWITDPNHPLTARVMVNRIWHFHIGRGIVNTPNDFGRMGERPTHPELLDYLANEFVDGGWSVKKMHRMILNSNVYQQSSKLPADGTYKALALETDPDNKLLWRANRRRLEAEAIRDSILAFSGRLNTKTGGQSILVPIDKELVNALYKPSQWAVNPDETEHRRRSIYLMNKRNLRLPFLEVFDQPDSLVSTPRRESSTHAPQALELLNGDLTNAEVEHFMKRLETEAGPDVQKQVELAYRIVTGRGPTAKQLAASLEFLKSGAKRDFALAMFNLNGFLYVN